MTDSALAHSVIVQLERILTRPPVSTSRGISRLLSFLVEETLAGRGREITEANIGARVFYRGADFNPRTDPIVRVEMHHLRARLEKYYATAGAEDPLSIELPARTYVPQFRRLAPAAPPPSRHWSCAPRRRAVLPGAW